MSFARNDPCPCGSLKKFKACCLGDEKNLSNLLMARLVESIEKEKALAAQLAEALDLYRHTKYRSGILYTKMLMIGPMFTSADIADQIAPVLYRFMQERGPNDKWPLHSEAQLELTDNGDVYISVPTKDGGHERVKAGNTNDKPLPIDKVPLGAVAKMKPSELPVISPHKYGSGNLIKDVLRNKEAIDKTLGIPGALDNEGSKDDIDDLNATIEAFQSVVRNKIKNKGATL